MFDFAIFHLGLAIPSSPVDTEFNSYSGAIKSNLGHLEGASGVAGLIKTILILERGLIPPNANFRKINPKINTEALKVKVWKANSPRMHFVVYV